MTDTIYTQDGKVIRKATGKGVIRISTADSPYYIPEEIHTVWVNATEGPVTVYLPPVGQGGRQVRLMKIDPSANMVTIEGRINAEPNFLLRDQFGWVICHDAETEWFAFF